VIWIYLVAVAPALAFLGHILVLKQGRSSIILRVALSVIPIDCANSLAVMRGHRAMWLSTKAWLVKNLRFGIRHLPDLGI
jgi:hypothetical protein